MAVFACYIEKSDSFQGAQRVFGNTYHFRTDLAQPFPDQAVIEAVAAAEQPITSSGIRFERGVTWGPTDGDVVDNVMRETVDLGFNGTQTLTQVLFSELCILVVWPMPRSVPLNRRRWLRKFVRVGALGTGSTQAMAVGLDPLSATIKDEILTDYAFPVTDPVTGIELPLCNEEGVLPNADPIVRDYLITRQIGR